MYLHSLGKYCILSRQITFSCARVCANSGRSWKQYAQSGSIIQVQVMAKGHETFLTELKSTVEKRGMISLSNPSHLLSVEYLCCEKEAGAQVNWNGAWPCRWRMQSQTSSIYSISGKPFQFFHNDLIVLNLSAHLLQFIIKLTTWAEKYWCR